MSKSVSTGLCFPRDAGVRAEDVWALLTDGARLADALSTGSIIVPEVGGAVRLLDASGTVTAVEAPTRIAFTLLPPVGRLGCTPKSKPGQVNVSIGIDDDGELEVAVRHQVHDPKRSYDIMMWWSQRVFLPLREALLLPPEPATLPAEPPPAGPAREAARALLREVGSVEAWIARLTPAGAPERPEGLWWKAQAPLLVGLALWLREVGQLGRAARVRAARAAASEALVVWARAERELPPVFGDVLKAIENEEYGTPAAQLGAVDAYLACPTRKAHRAATLTTDRTRQLRFTDEDMGDMSGYRWAYALEAATCAVYAIQEKEVLEHELAALCAIEALGEGAAEAPAPETVARVAESVRAALAAWVG